MLERHKKRLGEIAGKKVQQKRNSTKEISTRMNDNKKQIHEINLSSEINYK